VNGNVSRETIKVWQSLVIAVDNSTQTTATGLSRALCCVLLLLASVTAFNVVSCGDLPKTFEDILV